jgi:hypothetical protein
MGKRKKNKQRFTKHYTNINKTNNHLLPQTIENKQPPLTSNHSKQTTTSYLKPLNMHKKHHAILVWHS